MERENLPYAFPSALIAELDKMVSDPSDGMYRALRDEMLRRMSRAEVRNPFHAGAPVQYDEDQEELALVLKAEGMTTRKIATELGCSQSTVVRLLERARKKRSMKA